MIPPWGIDTKSCVDIYNKKNVILYCGFIYSFNILLPMYNIVHVAHVNVEGGAGVSLHKKHATKKSVFGQVQNFQPILKYTYNLQNRLFMTIFFSRNAPYK